MRDVNEDTATYEFICWLKGERYLKKLIGKRRFKEWYKRSRNDYIC